MNYGKFIIYHWYLLLLCLPNKPSLPITNEYFCNLPTNDCVLLVIQPAYEILEKDVTDENVSLLLPWAEHARVVIIIDENKMPSTLVSIKKSHHFPSPASSRPRDDFVGTLICDRCHARLTCFPTDSILSRLCVLCEADGDDRMSRDWNRESVWCSSSQFIWLNYDR
jgi:hypothetical protein